MKSGNGRVVKYNDQFFNVKTIKLTGIFILLSFIINHPKQRAGIDIEKIGCQFGLVGFHTDVVRNKRPINPGKKHLEIRIHLGAVYRAIKNQ